MNRNSTFLSFSSSALSRRCMLWFFWFFGVLAGMFLYAVSFESVLPLMCQAFMEPVSIVCLSVTLFLPLFCLILSVVLHNPLPILLCVTFKGMGFGYILVFLSSCFAEAFWFTSILFLFSDICLLFTLLTVCLQTISGNSVSLRRLVWNYFITVVCIGCVDSLFVSPLLYKLLRLS